MTFSVIPRISSPRLALKPSNIEKILNLHFNNINTVAPTFAADSGLVKTVATAKAIISGIYVEITANEPRTLTASQTNWLYLQLTRDVNNEVSGAQLTHLTNPTEPTAPTDSVLLAKITTDATTITATDITVTWKNTNKQSLFAHAFQHKATGGDPLQNVLDDLTDIEAPTPLNNQVLTFDSVSGLWKNQTPLIVNAWPYGSGEDGTVTISVNTDLGSANKKRYESLTINAGIVLQGNSGMVIICKTGLTFNSATSQIHVNGKGGAGGAGGSTTGGAGGSGGGIVVVIAKAITAALGGLITANGDAGGGGGAPLSAGANNNGVNGIDGTDINNVSLPNTKGLLGNSAMAGVGGTKVGGSAVAGVPLANTGLKSAGGGGGAGWSAGGGASRGGSGGGGGGGGCAVVYCPIIPAITLNANGGNGGIGTTPMGNHFGGGGGAFIGTGSSGESINGGGGGGGIVMAFAKTDSSTKTASVGAGGTGGTAGVTTKHEILE